MRPFPKDKSIKQFMDTIRARTRRRIPLNVFQLIESINPVIRGWGTYYRKAHVRKLFNRLQRWIIRRIWSHRYKYWRNAGWKKLPETALYSKYRLVNLLSLIPDLNLRSAPNGWHKGKRIAGKLHDPFDRADGGRQRPTSFDSTKIKESIEAAKEIGDEWMTIEQDQLRNLSGFETATVSYLNLKEKGLL